MLLPGPLVLSSPCSAGVQVHTATQEGFLPRAQLHRAACLPEHSERRCESSLPFPGILTHGSTGSSPSDLPETLWPSVTAPPVPGCRASSYSADSELQGAFSSTVSLKTCPCVLPSSSGNTGSVGCEFHSFFPILLRWETPRPAPASLGTPAQCPACSLQLGGSQGFCGRASPASPAGASEDRLPPGAFPRGQPWAGAANPSPQEGLGPTLRSSHHETG